MLSLQMFGLLAQLVEHRVHIKGATGVKKRPRCGVFSRTPWELATKGFDLRTGPRNQIWSVSSVGGASCSHRGGHWFESNTDHQKRLLNAGAFLCRQDVSAYPPGKAYSTVRRLASLGGSSSDAVAFDEGNRAFSNLTFTAALSLIRRLRRYSIVRRLASLGGSSADAIAFDEGNRAFSNLTFTAALSLIRRLRRYSILRRMASHGGSSADAIAFDEGISNCRSPIVLSGTQKPGRVCAPASGLWLIRFSRACCRGGSRWRQGC